MKIMFVCVFAFYFLSCMGIYAADRAILVHNSLQEIENCKGKLQLKLTRIWGGDEEEDENKFFATPVSVAVDHNQLVYICDMHNHCIKVFSNTGDYVRTIGLRGQGPGDLYGPRILASEIEEYLLIYETCNRRFQWFDKSGKSKRIIKYTGIVDWIGITLENEIAVYDSMKTFINRKLITLLDDKGKVLKEFGAYQDISKNYTSSEKLKFSIDKSHNIYAANNNTPVIRIYSPAGRLLKVITFETPFDIPVEIKLNSSGDEIEIKKEIEDDDSVSVNYSESGVSIQQKENKNKQKYGTGIAMDIDSKNRIYLVSQRRKATVKESNGTAISGSPCEFINRRKVDYSVVDSIDVHRLMVFDINGKIIAHCTMQTLCDDIYISNNKVFIIDALLNQRVLEYEMVFL